VDQYEQLINSGMLVFNFENTPPAILGILLNADKNSAIDANTEVTIGIIVGVDMECSLGCIKKCAPLSGIAKVECYEGCCTDKDPNQD
jgi:hypothetical protein